MLPQGLPVGPDDSVVTQSTSQTFINMRQQMQVADVPLVKDKRTEWTSQVDSTCPMMLRLLRTVFQMTLHLEPITNNNLFVSPLNWWCVWRMDRMHVTVGHCLPIFRCRLKAHLLWFSSVIQSKHGYSYISPIKQKLAEAPVKSRHTLKPCLLMSLFFCSDGISFHTDFIKDIRFYSLL